MKSVLPICAVALPLFFASCASKWTDAQKAQLNSLAVAPSVASDAYKGPIGNQQYSAPIIATGGGGGFAQGAAVGAAAQLVVEIAAMAEQKSFESRYADAISRVPGTVPGDLGNRIRKEVGKSLGSHPFLKGKISDASPNRFVVKVESYRYVRAGESGDVLVTPAIGGKFELISADGKKLISNDFLAAGTTAKPLTAFANDRALASRAFDEAISRVGLQAYNAIARKLGETALAETSPTPAATNGGQPLQLEPVSNLTASCNNPYKLTRDCNAFTGAGRKITVNGRKLKIAGSADGKVVLVRDASLIPSNSVSSTGSPQYDAVRDTLRAAGVRILRQRDLMNPGKAGGFYLEMDRDGYSVLAAH